MSDHHHEECPDQEAFDAIVDEASRRKGIWDTLFARLYMPTKTANAKVHDSYFGLVREFPLISIKSDKHLKEAQKVIDQLLAKGKLDRGEETYLDALSDLVELYEGEHYPIGPASDADILRHLMEAKDVSQTLLHEGTGIPKSTISEILAGKKPFSKGVIAKLAKYFNVDVSVLTANLAG